VRACVHACLQTLAACESAFEPHKPDLFPVADGRRRSKVVGSSLAPGYMTSHGWFPDVRVIADGRPPPAVMISPAVDDMPFWAVCMALASLPVYDGEEGVACCGRNIVMRMATHDAAQECVELLAGA
jgi:hypothetical protein